ncbi:MAG: FAD-dependent oxidoreductase [Pseudomonadota bacterium]
MARSFDVVVLGAGLAGHCAALEAAEAGARVMLVDKAQQPGGSTLLSSGTFAFAATALQREAGVEDSPERLRADLLKASGQQADPSLLQLYVERQGETFEWLRGRGVEFLQLALSSSMSVPRSHPTLPAQVMAALHERVRAEPRIDYRGQTQASRLLREGSRVVGFSWPDGRNEPAAAIVLATGGFSRNPGLLARFAPRLSQALAVGGQANVGEGHLMAWALGADLVDMAWINGTFGMSLNRYPKRTLEPGDESILLLAIYRGAIAVNLKGERFVDESRSYKQIGELCLDQPSAVAFQVFDQKIMDQSVAAPTSNDYRSALDKGLLRTAASLEDLAAEVGLDPQTLRATVERYNADLASAGADSQFGRSSLGSGWGQPVLIDQAPFYIYPCTTGVLSTYCGLRVDRQMRVVDVYDEPIVGLYAAGEIVGGFHGAGYMSGSALGKAAIFGRIAGRQAAALAHRR